MAGLEDYFYDLELSHEAEANAHGYETWAEYQDGRYLKAIREERNRREKYDY